MTVYGSVHSARFWYDGKNVNNAKEDAAEVALLWLSQSAGSGSPAASGGSASPVSSPGGRW